MLAVTQYKPDRLITDMPQNYSALMDQAFPIATSINSLSRCLMSPNATVGPCDEYLDELFLFIEAHAKS